MSGPKALLSERIDVWHVCESAGPPTRVPTLVDVVRSELRTRHYSRRTEKAYVAWIRRYVLFHGKRHPRNMGAPEVTRFLTALAVDGHVSASTQNQALSALLFLYRHVLATELPWLDELVRARRPRRLPVVLSREEVAMVIARLRGTPRLMACLLYGGGLRLLECARLRVKDVDFSASHIVVRGGKGDRDRLTILPRMLHGPLRRHLEVVQRVHEQDVSRGAGWSCRPRSPGSTRTPGAIGSGSGYFPRRGSTAIPRPASAAGIIFTRRSSSERFGWPFARQASRSRPRVIRFVTRSRRICWRTGTTFGRSRSSSVTET
jgi:integrase